MFAVQLPQLGKKLLTQSMLPIVATPITEEYAAAYRPNRVNGAQPINLEHTRPARVNISRLGDPGKQPGDLQRGHVQSVPELIELTTVAGAIAHPGPTGHLLVEPIEKASQCSIDGSVSRGLKPAIPGRLWFACCIHMVTLTGCCH